MREYEMYDHISNVINRATELGLISSKRCKLLYSMDMECAHKYIPGFSVVDLEKADNETFCHDFAGIVNNFVNRNKVTINTIEEGETPDFCGFIPRCCKTNQ